MQHHLCPKTFPPIPRDIVSDRNSESVVVIGAGVSGLFAALSLQKMGIKNLAVLEASGNFGGRLRAAPDAFSDAVEGCPFDVGAEWIHSSDGMRVLQSMMEGFYDNDGTKVDKTELMPYKPTIYFRSRKSRILTSLYKETKFKSSTWYHWLEENVYAKVKQYVEVNRPVKNVVYHDGAKKIKVVLADGEEREADRVICTVPLAILKESVEGRSLQFDPPLSDRMTAAIRSIDMPPGFRVLFRMKEKFYQDMSIDGTFLGTLLNTDDVTIIYDAALGKDQLGAKQNILGYVAIGHKPAGELSRLESTELGAAVLRRIDEHFEGKGSANIIGEPVVQNWAAEPYICGSYSFPGSAKHRLELSKPLAGGRLFFAGEHTSQKYHSLVPGAAYEGRRAALQVGLNLLRSQNPSVRSVTG